MFMWPWPSLSWTRMAILAFRDTPQDPSDTASGHGLPAGWPGLPSWWSLHHSSGQAAPPLQKLCCGAVRECVCHLPAIHQPLQVSAGCLGLPLLTEASAPLPLCTVLPPACCPQAPQEHWGQPFLLASGSTSTSCAWPIMLLPCGSLGVACPSGRILSLTSLRLAHGEGPMSVSARIHSVCGGAGAQAGEEEGGVQSAEPGSLLNQMWSGQRSCRRLLGLQLVSALPQHHLTAEVCPTPGPAL